MIQSQTFVVVRPACNAARPLRQASADTPHDLVDDRSADETVAIARELGIRHVILHDENRSYGANQKTCHDAEASSTNLRRSVTYGLGVLGVSARHFLHRTGLVRSPALLPLRPPSDAPPD